MPMVSSKRVIVAAGVATSNGPAPLAGSIEVLGGPIPFPVPLAASTQPPPLPSENDAANTRVVNDVLTLSKSLDTTTRALAQNFASLSNVSQAYVQETAANTAHCCETLLQASNFLDFQVNQSIECSRQILENMEHIHRSMIDARKLVADIKAVNDSVAMLETVLAQMEKERGIAAVPKKKGLFS